MNKLRDGTVKFNKNLDEIRFASDIGSEAKGRGDKVSAYVIPDKKMLGLKVTSAHVTDGGRNQRLRRDKRSDGTESDSAVMSIKGMINSSQKLKYYNKTLKEWFAEHLPAEGPCSYKAYSGEMDDEHVWIIIDFNKPVQ